MTVLAPEPELAAAPTHDATARRGHPGRQGPHSTLALFQAKKWDFALLRGTDLDLQLLCPALPSNSISPPSSSLHLSLSSMLPSAISSSGSG